MRDEPAMIDRKKRNIYIKINNNNIKTHSNQKDERRRRNSLQFSNARNITNIEKITHKNVDQTDEREKGTNYEATERDKNYTDKQTKTTKDEKQKEEERRHNYKRKQTGAQILRRISGVGFATAP